MRLFKLVLVAALTAMPALTFAQTPAPAAQKNAFARRDFNQHRRIANGVRNGRINSRKAARFERQQKSIHRHVRSARARHNGRLTMKDRRRIHRRQNVASRRIFRARHNHRNG